MIRNNRYIAHYLTLGLVLSIVLYSCKKEINNIEAETPMNPFDTIRYPGDSMGVPLDSTDFVGIHHYILSTTCAVPACHDGSFEPDFRTLQSAYNTLVYARVLKNNSNGDFTYRVNPGDAAGSWLHERITTDDAVLGRMPLYDTLSSREIELIRNWIDNGAKDIFGNSPVQTAPQPTFFGVLAFVDDTTGARLETIRDTEVSSMHFPKNTTVDIWFGLFDQDLDGNFLPANTFTYNKIKIANHLYDFTGAQEESMIVELLPYAGVVPFNPTVKAPYFHHYKINTSDYTAGEANYIRIYVKDADHSEPTEIPSSGTQVYLLTYFSFVVDP